MAADDEFDEAEVVDGEIVEDGAVDETESVVPEGSYSYRGDNLPAPQEFPYARNVGGGARDPREIDPPEFDPDATIPAGDPSWNAAGGPGGPIVGGPGQGAGNGAPNQDGLIGEEDRIDFPTDNWGAERTHARRNVRGEAGLHVDPDGTERVDRSRHRRERRRARRVTWDAKSKRDKWKKRIYGAAAFLAAAAVVSGAIAHRLHRARPLKVEYSGSEPGGTVPRDPFKRTALCDDKSHEFASGQYLQQTLAANIDVCHEPPELLKKGAPDFDPRYLGDDAKALETEFNRVASSDFSIRGESTGMDPTTWGGFVNHDGVALICVGPETFGPGRPDASIRGGIDNTAGLLEQRRVQVFATWQRSGTPKLNTVMSAQDYTELLNKTSRSALAKYVVQDADCKNANTDPAQGDIAADSAINFKNGNWRKTVYTGTGVSMDLDLDRQLYAKPGDAHPVHAGSELRDPDQHQAGNDIAQAPRNQLLLVSYDVVDQFSSDAKQPHNYTMQFKGEVIVDAGTLRGVGSMANATDIPPTLAQANRYFGTCDQNLVAGASVSKSIGCS